MAITAADLQRFVGWQFLIILPENGQRYQGTVSKAEGRKGDTELPDITIVFLENVVTDLSDNEWVAAHGESGQPVTCWHGNFADSQTIQPVGDGTFVINHAPAERILLLIPETSPAFLKAQPA